MRLLSLVQNQTRLEVAEVEIELIPGIPQIHFLGLPDKIIKESFYRIKSAFKSSGFKFPLTQQIVVNIKPNHLRKSSRGVELAVALGILLKTEQLESERFRPDWVYYGELTLDGHIEEPTDLQENSQALQDLRVLTGKSKSQASERSMSLLRLESLAADSIETERIEIKHKRPSVGLARAYSQEEAEFLFLAAASGLHALLAGDSGAGKSTLAQSLISFLNPPSQDEAVRVQNSWRPLVAPHNSVTPAAFLGGGAQLYEGEIERAQGGVLLLDELLEFSPDILEALRGPMTGETLRMSRGSQQRTLKSHFQVVATTNLCPCGKWSPNKKNMGCRFSRLRCTRYLERFSGPLLDRFGLLYFSQHGVVRKVSSNVILQRLENYYTKSQKLQRNEGLIRDHYPHISGRRSFFLEKVAAVYAREAGNDQIQICDYRRAEAWSLRPFEELEKGMN